MDTDHEREKRLLAAGATSAARAPGWTPPAPEALHGVFPNLQILELIGQGGMGAVYKARQTHLDRLVAVKLLAPHLTTQVDFAQRFQREARVLARLSHPHIVSLYDVGEAGPWRYLVMEYVEGATLREVLTTGPFTTAAALTLAPQLCEALAYAHAQGIIHRDLKPENILIDTAGKGHIADFGLATLRGADAEMAITKTGDVLGTAAYMAPEQLSGASGIDHRVDLYALGVIIYEMLTGHLPLGRFEVPSHQGRLDVRIDSVVLQALARTPELRWQSADEMGRAVDALKPGRPAPAPVLAPSRRVLALSAAMLLVGTGIGALLMGWTAHHHDGMQMMITQTTPVGVAPATSQVLSVSTLVPAVHPLTPSSAADHTRVSSDTQETHPAQPDAASGAAAMATTPRIAPAPPTHLSPASVPAAPSAPSSPSSPSLPSAPTTPTVSDVIPAEPVPGIAATADTPSVPAAPATTRVPLQHPAPPAALPDAQALNGHHLVIHGPGEMTITAVPGLKHMADLLDTSNSEMTATTSGDHDLVLTLTLSQAHAQVQMPQEWLESLVYDGSGRVVVHGCGGKHLLVQHEGTGTLELEALAVTEIELDDHALFLTRLSGQVQRATLHMRPGPGGLAQATAGASPGTHSLGYVDASHLIFAQLNATIDGGGCLRLQGHADTVVAELSDGFIDASGLSVAKADISVTASGQAIFGDLGALDARCTGTGTVRWTGNPVLGHVIINK